MEFFFTQHFSQSFIQPVFSPSPLKVPDFFLSGGGSWLGQQLAAKSGRPWILQALNFHSAKQLLTPINGKAVISRHFFFYRGVLLLNVWPYFSLLALAKKSKVRSLLRFTWQSIWKFSKQLGHHEKWIWTLLRNFITEFLNQWYYDLSTGICKEKNNKWNRSIVKGNQWHLHATHYKKGCMFNTYRPQFVITQVGFLLFEKKNTGCKADSATTSVNLN